MEGWRIHGCLIYYKSLYWYLWIRYIYHYLKERATLEILSLGYFGIILEKVPGTNSALGNLVIELDNPIEVGSVIKWWGA